MEYVPWLITHSLLYRWITVHIQPSCQDGGSSASVTGDEKRLLYDCMLGWEAVYEADSLIRKELSCVGYERSIRESHRFHYQLFPSLPIWSHFKIDEAVKSVGVGVSLAGAKNRKMKAKAKAKTGMKCQTNRIWQTTSSPFWAYATTPAKVMDCSRCRRDAMLITSLFLQKATFIKSDQMC
jgi:hypothetical protein